MCAQKKPTGASLHPHICPSLCIYTHTELHVLIPVWVLTYMLEGLRIQLVFVHQVLMLSGLCHFGLTQRFEIYLCVCVCVCVC
jgi:hypothetical protein